MSMKIEFDQLQAAHCETGVASSLLKYAGIDKMTEPLASGIGAGLFFVYIPFIKVKNGPAIAFRTLPGWIFSKTCHSLNIPVVRKKFSSKEAAASFLENCLESGQPVGCQVGVYYLSYFPNEYRFHFNAHNIIVYGKDEGRYWISDPIMETPTTLTSYELERVRFAKGALAPRGQLYYPKERNIIITDEQLKRAIRSGINRNVRNMLHIPSNIAGVKGIKYTGQKIKKWRDKIRLPKARLYPTQPMAIHEKIRTSRGDFPYFN